MKKIIAAVLLILLALSACTSALAVTDALVVGSDNLIVYLIDTRATTVDFGEGEVGALEGTLIIENRYDCSLDFRFTNGHVDGVGSSILAPANVKPGVWEESMLIFPEDGQDAGYLFSAVNLDFDSAVSISATGEVLFTEHVSIHGGLPGMDYAMQPESAASAAPAAGEARFAAASKLTQLMDGAAEPAADELLPDETPGEREAEAPYLEETIQPTLLLANDPEFRVEITAWNCGMTDKGMAMFLFADVENFGSRPLDFWVADVYFDQTASAGLGLYDVQPGTAAGDYFMFRNPDGGTGHELLDPQWISFRLLVKDAKTAETIREIPVGFSGDWLDTLPLGNANA